MSRVQGDGDPTHPTMSHRIDDLFDALADDRRRELLFDLLEADSRSERPVYPDSPPDAGHVLHQHVHLPKLADYGFIERTSGGDGVERGPRFEEIEPVLDC